MAVMEQAGRQLVALLPAGGFNPPQINWNPSPEIQDAASKIAFILVIVWIGYVLGQFALPSKRRGMMNGQIKLGGMIAAAGVIVLLLDLALVPTVVNWILNIIWALAGMFGLT